MNCFSHAYRFAAADPYFVVGTSIPDWLGMIDRKTRVRRDRAIAFAFAEDIPTRELARGIVQHHDDDRWFHETGAFAATHVQFTRQISELLANETNFRPHFVAHIALEMLIDASLTERDSRRLDHYYSQVQQVDPRNVEKIVNQIAPRETVRLAAFLPHFIREAYIYDYLRNDGVAYRLNRIVTRIGLRRLPREFEQWVGQARKIVRGSLEDLLREPTGDQSSAIAT